MQRDIKGIYTKYKNGEVRDVAGLDLEFPIPSNPDLLINNSGSKEMLMEYSSALAEMILKKWIINVYQAMKERELEEKRKLMH